MKTNYILSILMAAVLSSMSLLAQEQSATVRYEGEWPSGDGILYSEKDGLLNPKFQGGDIDDFALWVNTQVAFPMTGYANRTSRTVIVEFMVLKDGTVADAHAVFGTDPVLNEEAVKAVSKSPKWEPAELGGEKKDVRLRVPVVFSNE